MRKIKTNGPVSGPTGAVPQSYPRMQWDKQHVQDAYETRLTNALIDLQLCCDTTRTRIQLPQSRWSICGATPSLTPYIKCANLSATGTVVVMVIADCPGGIHSAP